MASDIFEYPSQNAERVVLVVAKVADKPSGKIMC